jgi:hypothetical protein
MGAPVTPLQGARGKHLDNLAGYVGAPVTLLQGGERVTLGQLGGIRGSTGHSYKGGEGNIWTNWCSFVEPLGSSGLEEGAAIVRVESL